MNEEKYIMDHFSMTHGNIPSGNFGLISLIFFKLFERFWIKNHELVNVTKNYILMNAMPFLHAIFHRFKENQHKNPLMFYLINGFCIKMKINTSTKDENFFKPEMAVPNL